MSKNLSLRVEVNRMIALVQKPIHDLRAAYQRLPVEEKRFLARFGASAQQHHLESSTTHYCALPGFSFEQIPEFSGIPEFGQQLMNERVPAQANSGMDELILECITNAASLSGYETVKGGASADVLVLNFVPSSQSYEFVRWPS